MLVISYFRFLDPHAWTLGLHSYSFKFLIEFVQKPAMQIYLTSGNHGFPSLDLNRDLLLCIEFLFTPTVVTLLAAWWLVVSLWISNSLGMLISALHWNSLYLSYCAIPTRGLGAFAALGVILPAQTRIVFLPAKICFSLLRSITPRPAWNCCLRPYGWRWTLTLACAECPILCMEGAHVSTRGCPMRILDS